MIPEFAIREWNEQVPWTESEQVEQDLLICRALTEIYKDEYLASPWRSVAVRLCISYFWHHSRGTARI